MTWPTLKTYDRVKLDNDRVGREDGFAKSYFGMRLVIGVIGVLLPLLLVLVEALLLRQPLSFRGSMSAYYHSAARDLFVGGLSACGVTLISYMFWKWWTWDFLVSFVGGIAVLGVAAFPTARPRDPADRAESLTCTYSHEGVPPCSALQQSWGESTVRNIHLAMTAAVVASFAVLCLVFALREFGYGRAAHDLVAEELHHLGPRQIWQKYSQLEGGGTVTLLQIWQRTPRTVLYLFCLAGVLVGAAWAPLGQDFVVPHTYAGEFVAFVSFGGAWIVASWDLLRRQAT